MTRWGFILLAVATTLAAPTAAEALCVFPGPGGSGPDEVCADVYPATNPIVVALGDAVPLPIHYVNNTGRNMTFATIVQGNIVFPGTHTFHIETLAPHTEASFTDTVLQTDTAMPIGTDHITIGWSAVGGDYSVTVQDDFEIRLLPPLVLQEVIQLPARWCVVEGSPQSEGKRAGELVSGQALLKILQRVSDEIWMPQAKILFRSAIADGIPVVCDVDPPPQGEGKLGDVQNCSPTTGICSDQHFFNPTGACRHAWERIAPDQPGRILVSTGAMYKAGSTLGVTLGPGSQKQTPDLCAFPRHITPIVEADLERSALVDQALYGVVVPPGTPSYSGGIDPAMVLAHEIGHQLFLGHGNGLDDNHDGREPPVNGPRLYDEYCDPLCTPLADCGNVPLEDLQTPSTSCEDSSSLMFFVANNCTKIRPLQAETARDLASVAPGAVVNGAVNPGDGRVSGGFDVCAGVSAHLIQEAGMSENAAGDTAFFYHVIPGTLPPGSRTEYLAFADLDNNAGTGCAASQLGFPTTFQGAEVVTKVLVEETTGGQLVSAALWRCTGTTFEPISDARIQATVDEQTAIGSSDPGQQLVVLEVPEELRGPVANETRVQTMARVLSNANQVERLPASDAGAVVSRTVPILPTCTLSRPIASPGEIRTASVSGLLPNRAVEVSLGEERVAQGTTDGAGSAQIDFAVPATSRQGVRPVSLLFPGTAVNAVCVILIDGVAVTPATTATISPEPNRSEWNNSQVTVDLAAVDVPGGPGVRDVSYEATGAQSIPLVVAPGATTAFAIAAEGDTTVRYFATNQGGVSEHPRTLAVRIDLAPPTITYTGNAGAYTVGETVNIHCSAADTLSGVVTTDCKDVLARAYTFGAGAVTLTASAVDFASNTGTGSTSFVVRVTYDSLCRLTREFVRSAGVADSLCSKLKAAAAADARRNVTAKAGNLSSYRSTLSAQSGKTLTPEQAMILAGLSQAL